MWPICTFQTNRLRDSIGQTDRAADGSASFDNIDILSKSWAAGLVHTVSETARHLDRQTFLINEARGSVHLAVLSLGRIILGWPLTLVSDSATQALAFANNVKII